MHLITTLHEDIKTRRPEVDHYHDQYYNEALQLAHDITDQKDILVAEEICRVVAKQQYHANIPGTSTRDYYKNNITIPMLDHLATCMDSCINENTELAYKAFLLLPNFNIDSVYDGKCMAWRQHVMEFATFYKDDLSNYNLLDKKLDTYHTYWVPSTVTEAWKHISFQAFTNIKTLLRILGTIPVTCTCERWISKLRLLKDYTKSTMINDRLSGMVLP